MKNKILVTGATGNVGSEIMRLLPIENARAADINMERMRTLFGADADCVTFDFARPETYTAALTDVSRIFLLRPPSISDVPKYIEPFLDAAKSAGVELIVFLSIQGVENNRFVPHYKIEQAILARDMPYTFLRCGFFMQNLSTTHRAEIRERGVIDVPAGKSKTSFIDVRDIAAVTAKVLAEDGHRNRIYTLTGSDALDYFAVAGIMTDVLGKPIRYTNPSIPSFVYHQRQQGRDWGMTLVMTMLYTITRFGNASSVTTDVARLTGRTPIPFRQFVTDYREAWV
ncbi:MAG: SDR family oxidoreductase [Chloroflexota bacterium]|nr:SDR family oxidoreductase [Chloroflexota bacterium]